MTTQTINIIHSTFLPPRRGYVRDSKGINYHPHFGNTGGIVYGGRSHPTVKEPLIYP